MLRNFRTNIPFESQDLGGGILGSPVDNSNDFGSQVRVGTPGSRGKFDIENAPEGYTLEDAIGEIIASSSSPEEVQAKVQDLINNFPGATHGDDEFYAEMLADDAAGRWREINYGSKDAIAPEVSGPKVGGTTSKATALGSQTKDVINNIGGTTANIDSDDHESYKPAVDYQNDLRPSDYNPLDDVKDQSRAPGADMYANRKEAETYGTGIFGGGQATGKDESVAFSDPTYEAPEGAVKAEPTGKRQVDYYNDIYASARSQGANHVQASLAASQASLETGYGKSVKGNSHFGIKTGSNYSGDKVDFKTHEIVDGKKVNITDSFRAYKGMDDSVKGYMEFMPDRFPDAWNATSFSEAAEGLKAGKSGGYATDPNYASKLGYITDNFGKNTPSASVPVGGNPSEMLSRPGDYGFEKNRGDLDVDAIREMAFDAQFPVPDVMSVGPTTVEGIESLMNPEARRTEMSSFGFAPENTHKDGVSGTVEKEEDDPFAPTPVKTQTFTVDPKTGQLIGGSGKGKLGGFTGIDMMPNVAVGMGQTRSADDVQNYQQYMQEPVSPMSQFNYSQGPAAGRGTPQHDGKFEMTNDRALYGATYGYPEEDKPIEKIGPNLKPFSTNPTLDRPFSFSAPAYIGREDIAAAYPNAQDRQATYDVVMDQITPTAEKSSTYSGSKERETYGRNYTGPTTKSVPVYDYVPNPYAGKASVANMSLADQYAAYGKGKTGAQTLAPEIEDKIRAIVGYKEVPVDVKGSTGSKDTSNNTGRKASSRYSERTQGIINAGLAKEAHGRTPGQNSFKGLFDNLSVAGGLKSGLTGLLAGGVPGALMGAVAGSGLGQNAKGAISGGYTGMHTGGTPSFSNGVNVGGAMDVYNDRSGRNVYGVANSGSVVARDADTDWTSVTSNVNGNGPVTTVTLGDGRQAATGNGLFGGGGESESGSGCVIATHAVASGAFTPNTKRQAVKWCVNNLHDKWWGEAVRRGYRYLGRKKIEQGKAHEHYKEFRDYIDFATGKKRTLKGAIHFVARTTQFFVLGLVKEA